MDYFEIIWNTWEDIQNPRVFIGGMLSRLIEVREVIRRIYGATRKLWSYVFAINLEFLKEIRVM